MIVKLVGSDKFMDDVVNLPQVKAIAEFLYANRDLIRDAALAVGLRYNLESFAQWKLDYILKYSLDDTRQELANILDEAYMLSSRPPKGESCKRYLRRIRGGILEALVARFVTKRYDVYSCNCQVFINGAPVRVPGHNIQTVDVIGVSGLKSPVEGEAYECKVGTAFVDKYDILLVQTLRKAFRAGCTRFLSAIVSFASRDSIAGAVKRHVPTANKCVIGHEDIGKLEAFDQVDALIG